MKKTFVLGLIGGIFGILGGLFAVMFGSIGSTFNADGSTQIKILGWVAILASIIAIVCAVQSKKHPKICGWIMVASGVAGLVAISMFYVLPAILIGIGGILAIVTSRKHSKK